MAMKKAFASLLALALLSGSAHADTVNVMAAFTLKNALDAVIQAYKADGGGNVTAQYGMTPMLAKQVENQAPGDIFLSADADWMNYLQDHGLIRNDTRVNLMTADLVLATRNDDAAALSDAPVGRDFPLLRIIGSGRMAMCNPADHPAGKLGRAGLENLGLWHPVEDKIAIAESPPAAVALVARGEAPVALVFSTDAKGVTGIKIAGVFPADSHPPIVFPAAILRDSRSPDAGRFLAFLASSKAAAVFEQYGYRPLAASR
jgi:molybdate transport system substrate-binding protein